MSSKTTDWREKYLNALDERDRLQGQSDRKQELLRRALVRVSLAAEGQDEVLDSDLASLRASIKSDGQLAVAVDKLESTLLKQEQRGINDSELTAAEGLQQLVSGLLQQARERETKKQLKALASEIKGSSVQNCFALMNKLVALQEKVFRESGLYREPAEKSGLLSRFLGRKPGETPRAVAESEQITDSQMNQELIQSNNSVDHSLEIAGPIYQTSDRDRFEIDGGFSYVSERVCGVLNEFLDGIEPTEHTEEKTLTTRKKLSEELSWSELVPTLEDIRDLVLQAYIYADENSRIYLQHLHEELCSVLGAVGGTVENYKLEQDADLALEDELHYQLSSMSQSVSAATEVSTLKAEIENHLQSIRLAVVKRQQARNDTDVGGELSTLERRLRQVEEEAKSVKVELEEQKQKAVTDSLTGLPNREAYSQRAYHEWQRMKRFGHPLILAVCDIDRFKNVNDTFGHQTGDRVLQVLGRTISQRLRSVDFMARYGGEEFVIILPETSPDAAFKLLDMIREAIAKAPFRFKQEPLEVTLSVGIVSVHENETIDEAFARADKLLYQAKDEGRNRCLMESNESH